MPKLEAHQPEWLSQAPMLIEVVREGLPVDADVFWKTVADNESWPKWFPGFKECSWKSAPPHGVGSVRSLRQDAFRVEEKITAWEPGKRWAMTVTNINVGVISAMAEDLVLTETKYGLDVRWLLGAELAWWSKALRPILVKKNTSALETAVDNLVVMCGAQHSTP